MSDNSPTYPPELEAALLAVLERHQGKKNAVGRSQLVWKVSTFGVRVHERALRECIKQLRRKGHLICSMPGTDGGYYRAANETEFDEFDRMEFGAKIADMNETRLAMQEAARRVFGEAVQLELIGD